MKKTTVVALTLAGLLAACSSFNAKDDGDSKAPAPDASATASSGHRGLNRFPIRDVLNGPHAHKFSGVKLYFGNQKTPRIARRFGEGRTSQRTNSFNKSAEAACRIVMASALSRMKAGALRRGADAVINIRSNYDNIPFSSRTEYECMEGAVMAGVALTGEFVRLK